MSSIYANTFEYLQPIRDQLYQIPADHELIYRAYTILLLDKEDLEIKLAIGRLAGSGQASGLKSMRALSLAKVNRLIELFEPIANDRTSLLEATADELQSFTVWLSFQTPLKFATERGWLTYFQDARQRLVRLGHPWVSTTTNLHSPFFQPSRYP